MAKRGFNASIIPLTEEQTKLVKIDIWDRKRSILYKRTSESFINNFENFKNNK
jgi:hypothetical protein